MHLQNLKDVHIGFTENAESKDEDLRCRLLRKICFLDMDLDACILELDFDSSLLPAPFNNFVNFQNMWDGHPQSKFVHVIGQHPKRTIVVRKHLFKLSYIDIKTRICQINKFI
jgi:hypothetical protein